MFFEQARNINIIIDQPEYDKSMYCQKLSAILGPDLTKKCVGFIEDLKEGRHMKVMK